MEKTINKKKDKWYIGGLNFECTGCGGCCSGPDEGYIWLKKAEISMLAGYLGLTAKQLIIASVVLAMYFPCVATFTTLFKELGFADTLKSTGIMIASSLVVGGLLNLIL